MDLSFLPDWPPAWPTAMAVAVLALFAAAAGEVAARWLRLPRLLGYLAAGALFGALSTPDPSVINVFGLVVTLAGAGASLVVYHTLFPHVRAG